MAEGQISPRVEMFYTEHSQNSRRARPAFVPRRAAALGHQSIAYRFNSAGVGRPFHFKISLKGTRAMAATFFVRIAGKKYGPFDPNGLRELAATRKLSRDDSVSRDGETWVSAASVKGLDFPPVEPQWADPASVPPCPASRLGPTPSHDRSCNWASDAQKTSCSFG